MHHDPRMADPHFRHRLEHRMDVDPRDPRSMEAEHHRGGPMDPNDPRFSDPRVDPRMGHPRDPRMGDHPRDRRHMDPRDPRMDPRNDGRKKNRYFFVSQSCHSL